MTMKQEKDALRKEIKERLSKVSREWVELESKAIQQHVIESEEFQKAECIFAYVNFGKEVVTKPIIEKALEMGKTVGVPLCMSQGIMEVRRIASMADLEPGAYGILEPKKDTPVMEPGELELGIIPCVTCDKEGRRMGHGAGYYDRYLAKCQMTKMILCFDEIMAEEVPVTPLDIPMDYVVSQTMIKKS